MGVKTMTQDEVDLIYDYLHENYEYKDGLFLHIDKRTFLNGFCMQSGKMRATLHINKKDYYLRYASLIWIYHKKETFYSFEFIDGNPTNNRIENLTPLTPIKFSFQRRKKSKGFRAVVLKNGGIKYAAEVFMGTQSFNFGTYENKEDAIKSYTEAKRLWVELGIPPKEIKQILIQNGLIPHKKKINKEPRIRKGYSFDKRDNKYYAFHYISKKRIGLGSFDNPEQAHEAYLQAKKELST